MTTSHYTVASLWEVDGVGVPYGVSPAYWRMFNQGAQVAVTLKIGSAGFRRPIDIDSVELVGLVHDGDDVVLPLVTTFDLIDEVGAYKLLVDTTELPIGVIDMSVLIAGPAGEQTFEEDFTVRG